MMFSTPLTVQPWSTLHRRIPLLQHIVALSVASAVRTIPGYEVYIYWWCCHYILYYDCVNATALYNYIPIAHICRHCQCV